NNIQQRSGNITRDGVRWDGSAGFHPDERHITNTLGALDQQPHSPEVGRWPRAGDEANPPVPTDLTTPRRPADLARYFDPQRSPLNPFLISHDFAYGQLPLNVMSRMRDRAERLQGIFRAQRDAKSAEHARRIRDLEQAVRQQGDVTQKARVTL